MLYLIESGLCLSILFVLYLLFFRKETYFTFNRYYLIGIIILSLIIPLVHVHFRVKGRQSIEPAFVEIGKFRNYYERLIALTDPDFSTYYENGLPRAVFEGEWDTFDKLEVQSVNQTDPSHTITRFDGETSTKWSILQWILLIYAAGVMFFSFRFLVLLFSLLWQLSKHSVVERFGIKIVLMPQEVPPFSFFRYVFIHEKVMNLPEFEQILAHERVHIFQSHSTDLLLAQALVIFQWFNPLVWQVQKAIKINHEFIADDKVVNSGFELFDYQTLLLSQLISIRSVELVNNFNLISIKKRITMMTKIKSGFQAKLKALVAIPVTIILLFLFTDLTISSPTIRFSNYSPVTFNLNKPNLNGMWQGESIVSDYALIDINNNTIRVLEQAANCRTYKVEFAANHMYVYTQPNKAVKIPYKASGNMLTIWWSPDAAVKYRKTKATNSLDLQISQTHREINLPTLTHYQILERPELVIDVIIGKDYFEVNGTKGTLNDFDRLINAAKSNYNSLDQSLIMVKLMVDKNTSMKDVHQIYQVLRTSNLLKIAYAGYPNNTEVPELLYHSVTIPKLLPPLDAKYLTEEQANDMKAKGQLWNFNAIKEKADATFKEKLKNNLTKTEKYFMLLEYNNQTTFGEYITYVDAIYTTVHELRNELAMKKHAISYKDLSKSMQKEIRKEYPITLSEKNIDED